MVLPARSESADNREEKLFALKPPCCDRRTKGRLTVIAMPSPFASTLNATRREEPLEHSAS
jgi:hypothetical protein